MSISAQARRRALAVAEAEAYGGALSRALLRRLHIDRGVVAREAKQGRWRLHGDQTVAVHTGPLSDRALAWRAIWEVGVRIAAIDGASSLQVGGLTGYAEPVVQVSVPHGCRVAAIDGVKVHWVARRPGELMGAGIPRTRPEVAAVRAAHWAVSDRQAALILAMPVQQRLVTGSRLLVAAHTVGGRARRGLIGQLARDIADGAQSLGELDFARMCRRRGLPTPSRQVVRQGPRGRIYLDVGWDDGGLVVEIDGAQHRQGLSVTDDNLRLNAVVLQGDRVLRIDLLGLRLYEDAFLDQVGAALDIGSLYSRAETHAISPRLAVARVVG